MPNNPPEFVDTSDMKQVTPPAAQPSISLNPTGDPEFSSLSLAPIPPVMGTETDAARQFYRPGVSQIRMPPLPVQSKIAAGASAQSQVINQQIVSSGGPDLQVNNVDNPIQNILNITGDGVSYGPGKGQVNIAPGGSNGIVGPAYVSPVEGPTGSSVSNATGGGANAIGGWLYLIPAEIITTNFTFNVQNADLTNYYDIGLYGPFTGVETTLPLICHTGSIQYTSGGGKTNPWVGGPFTIQPGYYFLYITSDGSSPGLEYYGNAAISWAYESEVVTASTGSAATLSLPLSIAVQSKSPNIVTSAAGPGIPQTMIIVLT
jgi:hypothetical protein